MHYSSRATAARSISHGAAQRSKPASTWSTALQGRGRRAHDLIGGHVQAIIRPLQTVRAARCIGQAAACLR